MFWCTYVVKLSSVFFFFQAEDGIRDVAVTGVQTCALPISPRGPWFGAPGRDRLFAEPDRQTATLAQASIIFRPVRYPILLPGDVMTAIGIDLERHGRISQEDYGWGSVLPSGTAQPDLPLAEVYGPAVILTDHREVPLSEEGWSSTPTRP